MPDGSNSRDGAATSPVGPSAAQRRWAVVAWSVGIAAAIVDGGLANVALPSIAKDLGASSSASIWVLNAAQLAGAVCVLPASALADSVGYKRVFLAGAVLMVASSILSGLAPTLLFLVLARVLAGAANGFIFSVVGAFMTVTYPANKVGAGLSRNAALISLSVACAPSIAAGVLSVGSWRWVFFLIAPFSVLAVVLGQRFLIPTERKPHRWDIPSTLLNAAIFILFILGLQGLSHGASPLAVGALVGAAVATVLFVRRQIASPAPILAIDLLRQPLVAMSVITMLFCFTAQTMTLVTLPFFLFLDGGPEAALLLTAWPLAGLLVAPIAGMLINRLSVGLLGGIGMGAFTVGVLALYLAPHHAAAWDLAWRIGLCGAGFGFFGPPNYRGILANTPPERSGAAGGITAAFRTLAQSTGAALAAVLFGLASGGRATEHSIEVVFLTAAALAGIGAVISISRRKL
jgi:MFS transporter, DHA2 family, multidrug resistance protein